MKHPIILPALISLSLSSPWVFAEEQASQNPPAAAPAAAAPTTTPATEAEAKAPENTPYSRYMEIMQKRSEHRKQMQEYMDKLSNAKTPEERDKLTGEYDQMMQKHWEEMSNLRGGYGGGYAAPWGEDSEDMTPPPPPPYAYGPYGPRWGGYPRGYGPRARNFSGGMSQPPLITIEQHLQSIEKLLTEIKEALPEKAK